MAELVVALALGGAAVTAIAVVGIALGRLVAPAIGRWADRQDEEPGDHRTVDR